MDDCDRIFEILISEKARDIETNGNFMGTRRHLAELIVSNGIGYTTELKAEIERLKIEVALLNSNNENLKKQLSECRVKRKPLFRCFKI